MEFVKKKRDRLFGNNNTFVDCVWAQQDSSIFCVCYNWESLWRCRYCNVLQCQGVMFLILNSMKFPSINTVRRSAHWSRCVYFFISLIFFSLSRSALQTTYSENCLWTTVPSLSNVNLCFVCAHVPTMLLLDHKVLHEKTRERDPPGYC